MVKRMNFVNFSIFFEHLEISFEGDWFDCKYSILICNSLHRKNRFDLALQTQMLKSAFFIQFVTFIIFFNIFFSNETKYLRLFSSILLVIYVKSNSLLIFEKILLKNWKFNLKTKMVSDTRSISNYKLLN